MFNIYFFEKIFKWGVILSFLLFVVTFFLKDKLPDPDFYDLERLTPPLQYETERKPFSISSNEQTYLVKPRYEYELEGIIVAFHDADGISDRVHHKKWKDYINVRDVCVVWGDNAASGVYQEVEFATNDWTCFIHYPDWDVHSRFDLTQASNNHLLIDDDELKELLMEADLGDHIRITGALSDYSNMNTDFRRATSVTRDTMCENIFVDSIEIIKKAETDMQFAYSVSGWMLLLSLFGYVPLFAYSPPKGPLIKNPEFRGG